MATFLDTVWTPRQPADYQIANFLNKCSRLHIFQCVEILPLKTNGQILMKFQDFSTI